MAFESLTERLNGVFKKLRGKGKLNEADIKAAMREVRMALLEADVNYKVAKDFCAQVSERAMGQEVMESLTPAQQVVKIVNEELTNLMGGNEPKYLRLKNKGQTVLMMCGLQGNGKTTHAAKLGKYYRSQGRRPLLVACDIYRPAAIEQLKVVGEQAGVPVFTLGTEKPEIIAQKAMAYAKDHGNDIVILDTAGRLQIDADSLDEKALPRIEAIIYSMTPTERAKPDIINPKRKRRIAAGSGTSVEDVNKLLRQFEMMQKMMKKVKRNPKGFMRSLGNMGGMGGGFRGFGRR